MPTHFNESIVLAAIEGFEAQKHQIADRLVNSLPCSTAAPLEPPPRRKHPHGSEGNSLPPPESEWKRRNNADGQRSGENLNRQHHAESDKAKAPNQRRGHEKDHRRHEEALAFTDGRCESCRKESSTRQVESCCEEGDGQESAEEDGPGCCTGCAASCRSLG